MEMVQSGVKSDPREQHALAKRLSEGLCPERSSQFMFATTQLAQAWNKTAAEPLPSNIAELMAKLEAKLDPGAA